MKAWQKVVLGSIGIFTLLPIWRSGDEYGLSLWAFAVKHTLWGDKINGKHYAEKMPWFPEQRKAYLDREVRKRLEGRI